jgi:hypothetical protein
MKLSDELWEAVLDHDFGLELYRIRFEQTGNPYYVWRAISVCVENKKAFPAWALTYLLGCAGRATSEKAKQASDLRKILPWIFGFTKDGKLGPGKLLDPENDPDDKKMRLGLSFSRRVLSGESPPDARANACNEVFGENADIDDKTLQKWILNELDLRKSPTTAEEWKNVCRKPYLGLMKLVSDHRKRKESRETPP